MDQGNSINTSTAAGAAITTTATNKRKYTCDRIKPSSAKQREQI
jgi:hypothetical protein